MPQADDDVIVETPGWDPDSPAVHREYSGPVGQPGALVQMRHPTQAFIASVPDAGSGLQQLLFEVANRYIAHIPELQGLALSTHLPADPATQDFGWLSLTWGDPQQTQASDPRRSFWVERTLAGVRQDRTAVLLAARRVMLDGASSALGDGAGLRVVLHVDEPHAGRIRVRVTGLSTAVLGPVLARTAARLLLGEAGHAEPPDPKDTPSLINLLARRKGLLAQAQAVFGFDEAPSLQGIAVTRSVVPEFELRGMGQRGQHSARRVFAWAARIAFPGAQGLVLHSLVEQRSHAVGSDDVLASHVPTMVGTPLSESAPTRPAKALDEFRRRTAQLPLPLPVTIPLRQMRLLADPRIEVVPSRVGNELTAADPAPLKVPDEALAMRSDPLAGAHAYVRAREFLQRFDAYGLAADSYFKMAKLPLRMLPRASFHYASNGETVNAQVSPDDQGQSLADPFDPAKRPRLRVAFGWANLSHREMQANDAGNLRAQPLGLAADQRWAWHEFGHVLNFASTGELEFRFAHSAGDALAAIVADPDTPPGEAELLHHLTFRWALLRRSHARPAHLGWCWCGRRSKLRLARHDGPPPIPGGYFEEQLMSSSLFRLYEVIGGDRSNLRHRRRAASDYVVYLVMRAIALLGPATVVAAPSADAFVSALIDADVGTSGWNAQPQWPEDVVRLPLQRVGGTLHKVIRWAFEQQGLYATEQATEIVEGPGKAPRVDIYIPGQGERRVRARGGASTEVDGGGYQPVPLRWGDDGDRPWHVGTEGIRRNGANLLRVTARNRGSDMAEGVSARAWFSPAGAPLNWQSLTAVVAAVPRDIGSDGLLEFAFQETDGNGHKLRGRHFVLAEVSCAADRANLDPASGLACSAALPPTQGTLLTDLVANDNNLGLRIVDFG